MKENSLRESLLEFLYKGPAHLSVENAISDIRVENRHKYVQNAATTIWEELEHMRIAQEDILQYTLDPSFTSPPWPEGYWPEKGIKFTADQWQKTVHSFLKDLDKIGDLVKDETIDLTDTIPHGEWRTYLREILLIIDHNAYHLGKIVHLRRLLGDMPG
jgi:uncharacterized damage-inducible protein DinB